ncbi:MAG: RNase adapter RapZ, partial [Nitrospirae bacterium]|nr:RNase adapter RapZ [Nitrospirota bacterium]
NINKVAIGVDVREKAFLKDIYELVDSLKSTFHVEIIFLEAEQSVLIRRYKETRRPHPLQSEGLSIEEAMKKEIELLSSLRELADRVVDTSSLTPHQLRALIMEIYGGKTNRELFINLISFGYKFGIPQNVDLLFDVRFLPNPYFIQELKDLTGLDAPVKEYVLKDTLSQEVIDKIKQLLKTFIRGYIKEGKSLVNIGIGCTGGRHRSPVIVEEMVSFIEKEFNLKPQVIHRDI